jgi:hypothetical protein
MKKIDIGYYEVNNEKFDNKLDAVLAAQKINVPVRWNFFDDIFKKVNWLNEPEVDIDSLYKLRAEQIRNSYDYVIVFCSGGADSTNIIRTFINNNIKVDEVIAIAPMSGLNNWNFEPNNVSDVNTISEIKFSLLPLLNEISKKNIKVTIYDFFKDLIKYKDHEWTYTAAGNIVTALTSHFTNVDTIPHINKLIEQGKRIALVYGSDKPIIRISPLGEMFFLFTDGAVNYLNMPESRKHPNVDRVLFYWSADLPELLVKQAHIVAKMLHLPQYQHLHQSCLMANNSSAALSFFDVNDNNDLSLLKKNILNNNISIKTQVSFQNNLDSARSIFQRSIVPFIYPTTHTTDLFQCQKVNSNAGFFTRDQDWIHILHADTKISQMILTGTKELYNLISPKYLNNEGTGFINNFRVYHFGNSKNFAVNKYV